VPDQDQGLVDRIRAGDYSAFEELVSKFERKVYALALKLTGNTADAEEISQDVFLTIYQKLDGFRGESALSSWIYRVTANSAFMKLRDRRKRAATSYEEGMAAGADDDGLPGVTATYPQSDWSSAADEQLERGELDVHLKDAIAQLPEKFKLIFLLKDVQGLSNEEIGDVVHMSVPAVKSRLHRARLFLREKLQSHIETNAAPRGSREGKHGDEKRDV
jgi:RNA polymerase sigma-70 factor (ECF subfamily)